MGPGDASCEASLVAGDAPCGTHRPHPKRTSSLGGLTRAVRHVNCPPAGQGTSMTTDADSASNTHGKALELNLDPSMYGTFAEIGAGQEVANWFLRVGAASGTVAQTICAYDKAFSDDRYGPGTRHVSRERLLSMLEREYQPLESRLRPGRGT